MVSHCRADQGKLTVDLTDHGNYGYAYTIRFFVWTYCYIYYIQRGHGHLQSKQLRREFNAGWNSLQIIHQFFRFMPGSVHRLVDKDSSSTIREVITKRFYTASTLDSFNVFVKLLFRLFRQETPQRAILITVVTSGGCIETPWISERCSRISK